MAVLTEELDDTGSLSSLLSDEVFVPSEPRTLQESGVNSVLVKSLVLKSRSAAATGNEVENS